MKRVFNIFILILAIFVAIFSISSFAKASFDFFSLNNIENVQSEKNDVETESTFVCGNSITDRDGFIYNTVSIGNQCWMSENLRTKTRPNGTSLTNLSDGSQRDCIKSDNTRGTEADCAVNGALYTWVGAMGVNTLSEAIVVGTGAQGICPTGWHIPTNDEFTTLERSVCTSGTCAIDFPFGGTVAGPRGTDEGAKLKVGGSSGFNGALVGRREADGTTFRYSGTNVWYWSSQFAIPSVYRRQLVAGSNQVWRDAGNTVAFPRAHSLRCIQNVRIDTTPPVFGRLEHSPLSPIVGQNVLINITAGDDYLLGNIKVYVDDINVQTCDFTGLGYQSAGCPYYTTTLNVGEHTYYAVVTDSAGNSIRGPVEGTLSLTVNPMIDITPPTITYIRHWPTSPLVGQLVSIGAVGRDDYLLGNTKLYLNGVNVQTCDFTGLGYQSADCSFSTTTLNVGEHTYYAVVTDSAGNSTREPAEGTLSLTVNPI